MGRNYYCEYCERSFKDTPDSRKKHLASLQHANIRAEHYNSYKDPETILLEESSKITCKRFLTNDCMFDASCRFSHYTPQMIAELRQLVANRQQMKAPVWLPDANEIARQFFQNVDDSETTSEASSVQWSYPSDLLNYSNLPPSLRPITNRSLRHSNFGHWGTENQNH